MNYQSPLNKSGDFAIPKGGAFSASYRAGILLFRERDAFAI